MLSDKMPDNNSCRVDALVSKPCQLKGLTCDKCKYIGSIGSDCRGRIAYCHYKKIIIDPNIVCPFIELK
mgnify:CR=1 FL=1